MLSKINQLIYLQNRRNRDRPILVFLYKMLINHYNYQILILKVLVILYIKQIILSNMEINEKRGIIIINLKHKNLYHLNLNSLQYYHKSHLVICHFQHISVIYLIHLDPNNLFQPYELSKIAHKTYFRTKLVKFL